MELLRGKRYNSITLMFLVGAMISLCIQAAVSTSLTGLCALQVAGCPSSDCMHRDFVSMWVDIPTIPAHV